MARREARDLALLLLRKASQDEAVVRKFLDDPEVADEVVAFRSTSSQIKGW